MVPECASSCIFVLGVNLCEPCIMECLRSVQLQAGGHTAHLQWQAVSYARHKVTVHMQPLANAEPLIQQPLMLFCRHSGWVCLKLVCRRVVMMYAYEFIAVCCVVSGAWGSNVIVMRRGWHAGDGT